MPFLLRKGAEGAECMIHLNSQAKGPILDRTLESFLKNTEGVIFSCLLIEKISQVKRQSRNRICIIYSFSVFFMFLNKKYII